MGAVYQESKSPDYIINQCDSNYTLTMTDSEEYRYCTGQVILLTVVLPLILILGVFGNLIFVYVALRISHMQTITNRYLVSLAVADVVFLCSAIGHKLWKYALSPLQGDDSPLGASGCVWIYFLSDVAYFSSLTSVTLVSIDRFMAVCRPQNRESIIKMKSYEIIVSSWILSAILASFLTLGNADQFTSCLEWPDIEGYQTWPKVIRFCAPLNHDLTISAFSTGLQTLPFFITLIVNTMLYTSIIKGLNKCISRLNQHGVYHRTDIVTRNQIAKMLVVNGLVFFCLLVPFELLSFFSMIASIRARGNKLTHLISNEPVRQYMVLLAQLCSYINSAVNPLVYSIMCARYRQAFSEAILHNIRCVTKKSPRINTSYDRSGNVRADILHLELENDNIETAV